MSRTRFISLFAAGLLITNILLVVFILFRPAGRPPHQMPREIIIARLHFTDAQVNAYDALIDWHRTEIRKTDEQILQLKNRLYSGISGKSDSVLKDVLIREIGELQMQVEKIHYKHFEDIRTLCTAEQLPYFDDLLTDIAAIFSKPKKEPQPQ